VLTRDEWNHEKWKEAAKTRGRRRAAWYGFLMDAPVYAGLLGLGILGFGIWWLWNHVTAALGTPDVDAGPGVPAWAWTAMAVLLIVTAAAFRPGRIDRLSVLFVKALVLGAAWLFLIGFTVQAALG
jgi:hypothetical protein